MTCVNGRSAIVSEKVLRQMSLLVSVQIPVSTIARPPSSSSSQRLIWSRSKGRGMRSQWMPSATRIVIPVCGFESNS
jgi:hypothetical protein